MNNKEIREYEGGDFGEIDDYYSTRQIQAAIANRAQKAYETFKDVEREVEELKNNPDVVDVVATKAALDAYDTSTLTDKDIVRVLADETHEGASTYYRWSTSTSSWTYIGKVGDYYTKTETDTLLDAKADKATTYTKTETDTLLDAKADKTTTYTKNETDTLLNTKEGKTITGAGAPTISTEAANVGQQYYDTTNEKLYYCSAIDTTTDPVTYTWEEAGGSGIPTDAKFWGASYDATNNRVDGDISLGVFNQSHSIIQGRAGSMPGNPTKIIMNHGLIRLDAANFSNGPIIEVATGTTVSTQPHYIGLAAPRGGIRLSNYTTYGIRYGDTYAAQIHYLATPTSDYDAANKLYVDTAVASAGSAFTNTEFNNILENA